jgi:hypothetical protein
MSEELTLHKLFGNRTAVDRHKRLPGSSTEIVDGSSKDFFSGARFSPDKDRGIAWRNTNKLTHLRDENGVFTDDAPDADARLYAGNQRCIAVWG